ncbi:MAG TPA: GMC family oxidoreductase [Polyangiaceae bacterium]|jgi:choline dehydrogenase-like flavoprotein|nr:GMC family oxidoreductase [Polyangiaceae bacterium]
MSGGFILGRDLTQDVVLQVDAVVIGTGAGGSIALRELARAGLDAIALEEGAYQTSRDFDQREDRMLPRLFQDAGGRATADMAIRVLQGRGVGGSTIHNTNLCKRTPDEILDLWARKYGVVGASAADMQPAFEAIERDLSVSEIPAPMRNANNEILRAGCEALGWRGGPLNHNRVGCQQSGFCELGCAYDAKQNALKIVLPQAIAAGARVYADVEAVRLVHDGTRVTGVHAVARDADGRVVASVDVWARVVVLAASAVGSAALARRSGIPDPNGQLGRGLRIHPGGAVAGRFDRVIAGWRGIPQSYECTEHLSHEEGSDSRVWIVPAFAHPVGAAATLPGFGAPHMAALRAYPRLAVLTAMVHDETSGEVDVDGDGRPILRYSMTDRDRGQLAKGLVACARLLLAAGAVEVTIPAIPALRVTRASELDSVDTTTLRPHSVPLTAVHPMGTLRMGEDPRRSVVGSTGEHHHLRGLFVSDGSLFPTSIGGPPQISIYAFALHLAPHMVERARSHG